MYRWLPPLLLFAVAAYVWNYNNVHTGSALVFPLLDLIPRFAGDIPAQVDASWKVFVGFGVVVALTSLWDQIRAGRRIDGEKDEA